MTKKAIVFDNSGTLLERFRVIKDVSTGELITHVNSLDLIDTCLNAALVVLQFNTTRLKDLDPNTLISDFILENNIEFDISYYSTDVSKEEITAIAKDIGTFEISKIDDGGCSAVPRYPETRADLERVKQACEDMNQDAEVQKAFEKIIKFD